jgi:quercetin dioxygenase-like cupin family protein
MKPTVVRSLELDWQPLVESGVNTKGLYVKPLRYDEATGRAPTFLLKFDPGASYPNHVHPEGEEVYVLEGEVRFGADQLKAGDYLYTPPGAMHPVFSKTGCTLFFIVPKEVEITGDKNRGYASEQSAGSRK